MIRFLGLVAVASIMLSACSSAVQAVLSNTSLCTSVAPPALLYPAPGMTGAPDGNFTLYIAAGASAAIWSAPSLAPSGGGADIVGSAWASPAPQPTPAGMATAPPGSYEYGSSIPALAAASAYRVAVSNTFCQQTFTVGNFTTK